MYKFVLCLCVAALLCCLGCRWQLRPASHRTNAVQLNIERYDRLEALFLTTGDYAALRQMNTAYPFETTTLIEDVLHLGNVCDADINSRLYSFFQDSVLQTLIADVGDRYANIDDITVRLEEAFSRLCKKLPGLTVPKVYTQIGSFDQSVIVCDSLLGISLDKYMGSDYPFYQKHYSDRQRRMMVRSMIVPDCLGFYLLSRYPVPLSEEINQTIRRQHMGRIQWVVNHVVDTVVFNNSYVDAAEVVFSSDKSMTYTDLLLWSDKRI